LISLGGQIFLSDWFTLLHLSLVKKKYYCQFEIGEVLAEKERLALQQYGANVVNYVTHQHLSAFHSKLLLLPFKYWRFQ